jgi:hypothetical protein
VGSKSDIISHYHSAHVSVILAHAIKLKKWSWGLSVMLEKTLRVTLVTKLCAILLMEEDFNATNKIVYRVRMLQNARNHNLMQEEIFSKKNRMADDGTLCKTLFFDFARQASVPGAIALVDASNCYDRIAHAMASLIFQAFGVPTTAIESMLGAIENMKVFLRTGFGDLATFSGGGISIKTQGLCQGNGAAPTGWVVISICIIGAHKKKGQGVEFLCPITQLQHDLLAILYVNDTNLLHIDLTKHESVNKVHLAIQESVNSWGNLLIARGALQPAKCFFSIILFEWKNGDWSYESNASKQELGITVPFPGGGRASINHKPVEHAEKTLGAMTLPDGNSNLAIEMMQEKVQQWINAVRNGRLYGRNVWSSLKVQFWPRIGYGLCSSTATLEELDRALHHQYYQIITLGGVVCMTPVRSRTIDAGFFGVGLPHLGIEALISMSNKLLMHYGCQTATGRLMQLSYSLLLVELGLLFDPLQESNSQFECLATHSWMKMLWEKLSRFNVKAMVTDVNQSLPREGDQFIMQVLIGSGYSNKTLNPLNQVRVSQQLLFMLDVLTALGNKINPEVLTRRPPGEAWLDMTWPNKHPTDSDFQTWKRAMLLICPSRSSHGRVG